MNTTRNKLYLQISTVLALAIMFLTQLAGAAPTWNSSIVGNWSVPGNWSPSGVPGVNNNVIFGNNGAGSTNIEDISSETINSLTYDWNNQAQQSTIINPGTLTVTSTNVAGTAVLLVGSAAAAPNPTDVEPAAITGAGGNLVLNGAGDIVVHLGNSAAASSHMAILDMSGLDSFTANVGRLLVGQAGAGAAVNRPSGTLILAKTNLITLSVTGTANPAVMVQDAGSNANGGTASVLTFGQTNSLYGDVMRFGGQKGNGTVNFNSNFSLPSLLIRNNNGSDACTEVDFGNNSFATSGNSTVAIADFTPGWVDLLANTVFIAVGNPGGTGFAGQCTSTVTLGAGPFTVSDLEIGYGIATTINGIATATLNVNNNFNFGTGATGAVVTASSLLRLARTNGSTGAVNGTLNINGGGMVIANTIVSGGGVSAITVSGGTLVISNTAGTLAAPIGTFTMSGAKLTIPALSTSASLNVKAISGDAVITISRIAPIGAYPASISIIHYQTDSGTSLTLASVGGLPAGYTGSLVDAGGGKVSLNLTAGPVADLTETWSGANSADWDFGSLNWLFHSVATNYFDTAVVIFNDSTTQTNISIDQPVSPNSITVNNNTLKYTFAGPGNIAGTASLTKTGSASLILDNSGGVNNISTVLISGGTLQIGAGDANGGISSVNITNNGALVVDRTDNVTLSSDIAGSGTLTQGGGGTLVLSGNNTYSGATSLTNGTLEIDQTSSGTGPVTTLAGTVLSGDGVVGGPVTVGVGGQFNPGPASGVGTFQAGNGLTLSTGSKVSFNLSASDPSVPANDSVAVTGNLSVNNNPINVNFAGTPQGLTYTLFTYSGSLSGSFNPTITGTHFATSLDTTSTANTVLLTVTGSSGLNLEWNDFSDGRWDNVTTNWLSQPGSTPSTFLSGDSVLFDDNFNAGSQVVIGAGVTVYPSVITNASDSIFYNIQGAGHIGGTGGIVKSGNSTLTISTVNSFTGTVDIQGGTLQIGNNQALGVAITTTVESGATLDLSGFNIGARPVTISGSGVGGAGAIINSGGAIAPQALGIIVLAADATIGGSGNWALNNSGVTASLTGAFNLTKVGANQITLQNLSTVDAGLKNIDIQQGILDFNGITPSMGDSTFTNIVETGAELSFDQDNITWNKNFVFNGNGTATTVNNGTSATTVLNGPVILQGGVVFNVGGTLLTISNSISGSGSLIKNGGTAMVLTGPTTFTGDTTINAAALRLAGSADLSGSTNIIVNAGATLTLTGLVSQTITIPSGHFLKGNGVVSGFVTASAGSTVSPAVTPGASPVGTLTVSNAITLSGTTVMQLDPANHTNDVLKSGLSTITYGGILSLTNLSTFTNGSSFKIFSALNSSSYLGSFTSIVPATPGVGLAWNTSALNTSGTISVVSTVTTPVKFSSITIAGGNAVLSGSNGVPNNHYIVTTSTNLALAFTNWTSIATNTFDVNGKFNFTNSLTPPVPQRFYLLQIPGN